MNRQARLGLFYLAAISLFLTADQFVGALVWLGIAFTAPRDLEAVRRTMAARARAALRVGEEDITASV